MALAWMRRLVVAGLVLICLAGCGSQEPAQRQAFIGFLQTRVLDKPGVHVPQLTEDEKTAFGPYAEGWSVITAFHRTMDESVAPKMTAALSKGGFRSLDEIVARHGEIADMVATMDDMGRALGADVAAADAARGRLAQPDDLKAIYGKTYERLVREPAQAFAAVKPVFDGAMAATLKLADYLEAHKDRVKIVGGTLQVSDTRVEDDVNALIHDIQAEQTSMAAAQNRMQAVIYGN